MNQSIKRNVNMKSPLTGYYRFTRCAFVNSVDVLTRAQGNVKRYIRLSLCTSKRPLEYKRKFSFFIVLGALYLAQSLTVESNRVRGGRGDALDSFNLRQTALGANGSLSDKYCI